MSVLAIFIFVLCSWAVFSRHFCDGIIAKHFFVFGAITAALAVLDPHNQDPFYVSIALCTIGFIYWGIKHLREIIHLINGL